MEPVSVWTPFFAALITTLATGLGAAPFFLVRSFSQRWLGIFNAIAGGLMLGACFGLINEGVSINVLLLVAGIAGGVVLIAVINHRLENNESERLAAIRNAGFTKALLIIGVMTLHSFAEGIGVGVAYGGGQSLGLFFTAAISIHNIPEGLAISLILVPKGTSPAKAGLWSIFTSLPQPIMAVPAFLLVTVFAPFLPFGLGLAAGAMMWMVFSELIPESLEHVSKELMGIVLALSVGAMIAFQSLF